MKCSRTLDTHVRRKRKTKKKKQGGLHYVLSSIHIKKRENPLLGNVVTTEKTPNPRVGRFGFGDEISSYPTESGLQNLNPLTVHSSVGSVGSGGQLGRLGWSGWSGFTTKITNNKSSTLQIESEIESKMETWRRR
jgi:hypothetical protein